MVIILFFNVNTQRFIIIYRIDKFKNRYASLSLKNKNSPNQESPIAEETPVSEDAPVEEAPVSEDAPLEEAPVTKEPPSDDEESSKEK